MAINLTTRIVKTHSKPKQVYSQQLRSKTKKTKAELDSYVRFTVGFKFALLRDAYKKLCIIHAPANTKTKSVSVMFLNSRSVRPRSH